MKRIAAILLTLIVCFNTVGYFFVFKAMEVQIKSEMKQLIKENVPDSQLVVIRLTTQNKSDFVWIHNKEFRYKECMFDIVKFKIVSPDATDYYCLPDDRETGLFKHLNDLVKEMMNGSQQVVRINSLFSVFLAGLFPPIPNDIDFFQVVKPVVFCFTSVLYSYMHFSIIPHPPQF